MAKKQLVFGDENFVPYIGYKMSKPRPLYEDPEYLTCVEWCRANNATIEDKETYYEVVEIPGPTLEEAKSYKMSQITSRWNSEDEKPVTLDGVGEFDCDTLARNRITVAISGLSSKTATREWTLTNGTTVEVTKEQLQNVMNTWMTRCDAYHTKYLGLKARVDAAKTVEEVEAINWDEEEKQ